MEKTKFEYKGCTDVGEPHNIDFYEAVVELPTDDCPGSKNKMLIRIEVNTDNISQSDVEVYIVSPTGKRLLTTGTVGNINALANALYGAARKVTKTTFEPV